MIYKCPVRFRNQKQCDFKFGGKHYTAVEPHLESHTVKELSQAIHNLLGKMDWSRIMGEETIEALETLLNKGMYHDE